MIGTQVGPFTIVCRLGEGGMGAVYLAEHAVLKTRRAVKFLSPQLTQNPQIVRRFVNEARAAAKLHHRNLIQVHDVGRLPSGDWFMVLDYLDGHTLGRFMARKVGPLPPLVIVHIVSEIANGLSAAHRNHIVHRDLKPENVFLMVREGDPYHAVVLDFGVAQLDNESAAGGTRTSVVLGTPAYMPPEQLRGAKVTAAADVFALGVIAYQMSTGGWFPHQHGESRQGYCDLPATELYHRQMTRPPVDPRDRWPTLGAAWVDALLSALAPDPAKRPPSAGAFALRLAEAVPATGTAPGGIALVRTYARELVDVIDGAEDGEAHPTAGAAMIDAGSRYQLGEPLGAGGMAEVFAGTMTGVEGFVRKVAIKRVLAGLSQIPSFATMFVAEAQIASRLAHTNIVSVLDFSRDPEDRLFLVMEYVDGKDLASVLESGPISPSLAIFIVVEMLRGLGYAHDLPEPVNGTRGVVHRDVSPQNLLLSHEGAVKVSDFGLAKARAASDSVRSDTVRGKPGYMSPEQCAGEPLDGRSDLYSVGVMLWEMLAHRALFVGTAKEILAQVLFKDIPVPSIARRVPGDVAAVAMKLLARDRHQRYPTAAAAIEALLACGDAPRDGRGELVQLLAERFPRAIGTPAATLRAGAVHGGQVGGAAPSPRAAPTAHAAVGPGAQRRLAAPLVEPGRAVHLAHLLRPAQLGRVLALGASAAPGDPQGGNERVTVSAVAVGTSGPASSAGAGAGAGASSAADAVGPHGPRRGQHTVVDAASTGAHMASEMHGVADRRRDLRRLRGPWGDGRTGMALVVVLVAALSAGLGLLAREDPAASAAALTSHGLRAPGATTVVASVQAASAERVALAPSPPASPPAPALPPLLATVPAAAPPDASPDRPAPRRHDGAPRTGELAILVEPWAMIWLNGKPSGQTPFRAPVAAGRYRVRLANDDLGRNEITTVTVEPDRTATIERTW